MRVKSCKSILTNPETALVTDMRGECKAGATPHTTLYPTRLARPKVKKLSMKAVPVAFPSAMTPPIPAVTTATSLEAFCQGVMAVTFSSTLTSTGGAT